MESKNEKIYFWRKNSIHIIDLTQTVEFFKKCSSSSSQSISSGGKLLVVSTKKQASEQVSELSKRNRSIFM